MTDEEKAKQKEEMKTWKKHDWKRYHANKRDI
jgi:hypothetical protein